MKSEFHRLLERRKAEIVTAALRLADRFGIGGVTTKRIADEVGFVEGALYKHIRSKKEIFSVILDVSEKMIDEKFGELSRKGIPPDEALREWFLFAVAFLQDYPGIYRILFTDELYVEKKELFEQFRRFIFGLRDHFAAMIRAGIRTKRFRKNINPEWVATLYLGVIHTAFSYWNIFEERRKKFKVIAVPLFEEFIRAILNKESNRKHA